MIDFPTLMMSIFGIGAALGLAAIVIRQFRVKHYVYTTPKITIRPEGGGGSCSGDGACEWGQGDMGPQVETVKEVEGDGSYYPLVKADRPYSENWSYKGVEVEIDLPIHVPSRKDA